jgi:hypothetical protein
MYLKPKAQNEKQTLKATCILTLREKLGFSTMVTTMFQLHFEVENVTSNCKMFFQLKMTFSTSYQNS